MARIVKKLSEGTEYLLVAANAAPTTFTVGETATTNAMVTINGNLTVLGTQTIIHSDNTFITDSNITLNSGETGAGVSSGWSGIEVDRGSLPQTKVIWNEFIDRWQLSNDGTTYANIATISGAGYLSDIVEDLTPQLGGNLDVNGYTITSVLGTNVVIAPDGPTGHLQLDSVLELKEVPPPVGKPGYALLFANSAISGGSTGVYITHDTQVTQELITKKRALAFSIILG